MNVPPGFDRKKKQKPNNMTRDKIVEYLIKQTDKKKIRSSVFEKEYIVPYQDWVNIVDGLIPMIRQLLKK